MHSTNHAKVVIWLDTRRKLANGKYRVRIRVSKENSQNYIKTDFAFTKKEFERCKEAAHKTGNVGAKDRQLKKHWNELREKEAKAQKAAEQLGSLYSYEKLKKIYFNENSDESENKTKTVFKVFDDKIEALEGNNDHNSARGYRDAKKRIQSYKRQLTFYDIDAEWLRGLQKNWETKKSKRTGKSLSINTIAKYMRSLRTVYNIAIEEGYVSKSLYPFAEKKNHPGRYQIPTSDTKTNRALNNDEIKKVLEYNSFKENTQNKLCVDIFRFSYFTGGMNLADIARLKWIDIKGGILNYQRKKTRNTTNSNSFLLEIEGKALEIINEHKINNTQKMYVFDILKPEYDEKKITRRIQDFNGNINKWLEEMRQDLEIGEKGDITMYVARHSAAMALKRAGVDIYDIMEILRHKSIATTLKYLSSITIHEKGEILKLLSNL